MLCWITVGLSSGVQPLISAMGFGLYFAPIYPFSNKKVRNLLHWKKTHWSEICSLFEGPVVCSARKHFFLRTCTIFRSVHVTLGDGRTKIVRHEIEKLVNTNCVFTSSTFTIFWEPHFTRVVLWIVKVTTKWKMSTKKTFKGSWRWF